MIVCGLVVVYMLWGCLLFIMFWFSLFVTCDPIWFVFWFVYACCLLCVVFDMAGV